jgi:hypothetical protein
MKRNAHKFNAVRTEVDGYSFASKAEARRYSELKMLEKAGQITGLVLQPRFPLHVSHGSTRYPVGSYVADFAYHRVEAGGKVLHHVIEDVKGMKTPMYRWKKRHFEIEYNHAITEIGRATKAPKAKRARTTRRSAAR